MNEVSFIAVQTVAEASRLLKGGTSGEAVLVAGGTDVLIQKKQKLIAPRTLVYLKSIPALSEIRPVADGGISIGALTTLDEVTHHPEVKEKYPILAHAAFSAASPQIRHKATLGGNICFNSRCWFYNRSPYWRSEHPECRKASGGRQCYVVPGSRKGCFALQSGDTVGPLVALGAKLRLVSDERERILEIDDLYLGDGIRYLAFEPGEILTEILLPSPSGTGTFFKFRNQNNLDFAIFTLSVLLPCNGKGSRIVVASVASQPLRARKAEGMLDQGARDAEAVARAASEELKLVSFVRGTVHFKKQVIECKLTDLLKDIKSRSFRK